MRSYQTQRRYSRRTGEVIHPPAGSHSLGIQLCACYRTYTPDIHVGYGL